METPIRDWAKEIHRNAKEHGWWDEERRPEDIIALCHSELSEALEEHRAGNAPIWAEPLAQGAPVISDPEVIREKGLKPEGTAVEMIDCVIRILDYLGWLDSEMHYWVPMGRKMVYPTEMRLPLAVTAAHAALTHAWEDRNILPTHSQLRVGRLWEAAAICMGWVLGRGISPEAVIDLKHRYNVTRPYKHGGKVI